jgi:bifunctional DNA-binding transcriptional regulator/antitoxin component of YhaV-PrlF toxin-antitoxin module
MTAKEIEIVKSWRNNDKARTTVFPLPYKLAEKYGIEKPANLYLIPRKDGILLRKVELEEIE